MRLRRFQCLNGDVFSYIVLTVQISTWHVSRGSCLIRLCFTNLWLKLKTSDGGKRARQL